MQQRTQVIFAIGLLARVALLLWGEYQDRTMVVKYTDVDYDVYTDASREVVAGNSPFDRTTYRYTPLLAFILLPNVYVYEAWGKLLFVASDMVVAYVIYAILQLRAIPESTAINYTMVWLFHPFSINISTRGNADTLVVLLCMVSLYLLMKKQLVLSALIYGLAVHFKIYPIVYALAFLVFLDEDYDHALASRPVPSSLIGKALHWLNRHRLTFGLVSGGLFLALTGLFYAIYGYTFLFEGYLYHFSRTDNRHNFSMYFYDLYLRYGTSGGFMMGLIAFLPQFLTLFNISLRCGKDLIFAQFLLTVCFVVFNKVCTAQYFLWYSVYLPLVLPHSELSGKQLLAMIGLWFGGELHWLYWAFGLEIMGQNTFFNVWIAGLVFFVVNIGLMIAFNTHHHHAPLFAKGEVVGVSAKAAKTD
ncbi:hypothetical protein SDRG_06632 [Saprolegnia diclina VS20]|uniref:GPI mannosyltransferase 1 n=1 Tax=Saprolegnia diclina (strain VS20) TaxID=1156394 RepID=T0RTN7_SAPDV|nr:hypothetical protein SDRG_06632 [Saprolegnia diclina VS20]EQC35883.1 hypothetical protein SDRG_06632 [Saprolegnia diclina VS20]|eukprot:XP_008610645.1 hypothetical protein SDRG_06632 [Saprolegnia diclina VS20]